MNKNDSLALKGIAIIMMLLYHLFYCGTGGGRIPDIVYLNSVERLCLVRFSELCYPVSLYVMLTGYGFFCTFEKLTIKKVLNKVLYIFLHLWLIYLILLPVACYIRPDRYPGSIMELVKNVFSIESTYCTEQWFLLPYIIMLFSSKLLCRIIDRCNSVIVIIGALFLYLLYLLLYKAFGVGTIHAYCGIFVNIYFVMGFMLPFTLGAIAKKEKLIELCLDLAHRYFGGGSKLFAWGLLILLISFRMVIHNQSLQPIAIFALLLLFPMLMIGDKAKNMLMYLGRHSMNIWLIHGWICFYLFKDIICLAKYPIGILTVTLIWSLLISVVVETIYNRFLRINE